MRRLANTLLAALVLFVLSVALTSSARPAWAVRSRALAAT